MNSNYSHSGRDANSGQHRANGLERFIYSVLSIIAFALCVVVILFSFVFKTMIFTGDSMQNTICNGDKILVNILDKKPACGDIAVIVGSKGNNRAVKRVIAIGGQTVSIDYDADIVYVDGKALSESYIKETDMLQTGDVQFPFTVPENCIFVMGDNRNISLDSRFNSVGVIAKDEIIGTVLLCYNKSDGVKFLEDTPIDTDFEQVLDDFVSDVYEALQ